MKEAAKLGFTEACCAERHQKDKRNAKPDGLQLHEIGDLDDLVRMMREGGVVALKKAAG